MKQVVCRRFHRIELIEFLHDLDLKCPAGRELSSAFRSVRC